MLHGFAAVVKAFLSMGALGLGRALSCGAGGLLSIRFSVSLNLLRRPQWTDFLDGIAHPFYRNGWGSRTQEDYVG